ncbi:TIGR04104 family putative zinc finger protein [Alkalibacillus almallahensis]|uniref:TIGR04104 family putative zinc finger protein n=1 Tax=Alkalibacillus almallahensis TaxID=1379154 RepID=UPI00141E23D5|nr:TIGR04104 family putative zinc finger protein [Alkalibacillus almallahensis]NIK13275.1 CXXC-20-CXXC protein [Alkalibacillus almallahensis]
MFSCASCGYKFKYKEAMPFSWNARVGRDCPNCGTRQYYSAASRKKSMYFTLVGMIIIIFSNSINLPLPYVFLIAGVMVSALLLLTPFIFELSDEEEPMW